MKICQNCGAVLEDGMQFCTTCGAQIEVPQQVNNQQPVYQQQQYQQQYNGVQYQPVNPQPAPPQQMKPAGKVMGIISLVLGIQGLVQGIIMPILTLLFMIGCSAMSYSYYVDEEMVAACGYMFGLNLVGVACGIVAVILAGKARANGNFTGMTRAGKGLGIPSIILSGIALLFSFISFGFVF